MSTRSGIAVGVVGVVVLVGCAPKVTPLGNGRYMSRVTRGMTFGSSSAVEDAVAAAHKHCAAAGKSANVIDTDVNTSMNQNSAAETAAITFECE